jgi:hypothetical protein
MSCNGQRDRGRLATGGSTNQTLHLIATARVAGIVIDWGDFGEWFGSTPDEKAGRICFARTGRPRVGSPS